MKMTMVMALIMQMLVIIMDGDGDNGDNDGGDDGTQLRLSWNNENKTEIRNHNWKNAPEKAASTKTLCNECPWCRAGVGRKAVAS